MRLVREEAIELLLWLLSHANDSLFVKSLSVSFETTSHLLQATLCSSWLFVYLVFDCKEF